MDVDVGDFGVVEEPLNHRVQAIPLRHVRGHHEIVRSVGPHGEEAMTE